MASIFNMGRVHRLDISIFYFILVNFIVLCSSLYEDQIGKFDWRKQYIGQVNHAFFEQSSQTGRRILVGTDQNVIASLNARTGQIVWRQILETGDAQHTQIDDMVYLNNRIISVTGGGSHVRSWSAGQGQLQWDVNLTPKIDQRAQIAVFHKSSKIAVLTKDSVSCISFETGKQLWTKLLPDSDSVTYTFAHTEGDMVRVFGYQANSHVTVITITADGAVSAPVRISAAWLTSDTSCELTALGCLVCVDALSRSIHFLQSATSGSFSTQSLQDLGLDAAQPRLLSLQRTASAGASKQDIGLSISASHLTILRFKGSMVTVVKDLPGVSAAHLVTHSEQELLLTLTRLRPDVVEMKAYDVSSGGEIADFTQNIPYPQHHGLPKKVFGLLFKRKDGVTGLRALVVNEDHSLLMAQHSGSISWTREESLSNVRAVEMVDLPLSENEAKMEDEFGSREDDIVAMFVKRISTQFSQVKTFLFHLKHKLRLSKHHHPMEDTEDEDEEDEDYLTRDDFNLHKMIIMATSAGKVYGMDSVKGRIIWQHFLPNLSPFQRFGQDTLLLLMQRTTAHFPNPPQCVLLGKHRESGRGLLYVFNPITGQAVEAANGIHLDFGVQQASLLSQNDDQFLKGLLMLGTDNKVRSRALSGWPLTWKSGKSGKSQGKKFLMKKSGKSQGI